MDDENRVSAAQAAKMLRAAGSEHSKTAEWLRQLRAVEPPLRREYITTLSARIDVERGLHEQIAELAKRLKLGGDPPSLAQLRYIMRRAEATKELNRSLAAAFPKWEAHSKANPDRFTRPPHAGES